MPGKMCPFRSVPDRIAFCNFQCMFYIESEDFERRCLIKESLGNISDLKTAVEKIKDSLEKQI